MMLFPLSEFLRLVLEAVLENIFLDFLKFIFFGLLILVPYFVILIFFNDFRCQSLQLYQVDNC